MAFFKSDAWITLLWVVVLIGGISLLIQAAMLVSGKKCAKWNKKYNIWTQQWVDTSPCLQFE
jgi:hypothetical protein